MLGSCGSTAYDIGPVTCVKDEHCDPYPAPPHATVTPSGNVTEGNCVHIECDPGYHYDDQFEGKTGECRSPVVALFMVVGGSWLWTCMWSMLCLIWGEGVHTRGVMLRC